MNTKQILQTIAIAACLLMGLSASAYDFNVDGLCYNFNSDGTSVSVTYEQPIGGYSNLNGALIIPETVTYRGTTYSVTTIGLAAFYGCTGLTSVIIPNSVTSIEEGYLPELENCSGLNTVTIPDSVSYIFISNPFYGCSGLESIVVASGNSKYDSRDNCNAIIETATNNLIAGCKTTIIPTSVTTIGDRAFYGCSGLTSVTIPNSVVTIDDRAFYGCSSLSSVIIPNSVISIGTNPFSGCSGLESIVVASGNSKYDSRDNCNAIIETATNNLITGCKTTTISTSVTSIGDYAFLGCTGLTSVTIPNSVTKINTKAFYNCSNLADIYSEISNPTTRTTASNAFQGVSYSTCKLHIPADTKHMYVVTTPWNNFENMIGTFDYFEFVDKDGNVVPNEATLTLTEVTTETDVFTGVVSNIMYSHLKVRNKDGAEHAMRINMLIERMDNGAYQLCFPWTCKSYDTETNVVTDGEMLAAGEMRDLQTEWVSDAQGGCDVTLTVEVLNRTGSFPFHYTYVCDGPTVTLHYRNGITDPVNGDINSDGMVDILDVNAVINCMLGRNNLTNADVNGDGVVDIFDVNAVINRMLGVE